MKNKKLSYEISDFETISQKQKGITQTLKDVFEAKLPKRHGGNRKLIFDKSKLERIGKLYNLSIEVEVTDRIQLQDGEVKEDNSGTHGTHGTDVGLDRHLSEENNDSKTSKNTRKLPIILQKTKKQIRITYSKILLNVLLSLTMSQTDRNMDSSSTNDPDAY